MRYHNKNFYKTMILGIIALGLACFHNAHAANIYKCVKTNGEVVYQDFACLDKEMLEMHHVEINQSADIDVGLRPYEKVVLQRIFEKQMLEIQKRT